jgi:hypothetical protein
MVRKLKVLERDLLFALTNQVQETAHYLDLETGDVIPVFSFNRDKILARAKEQPERYLRLVPQSARQGREMMERFIQTVSQEDLKARLTRAIAGSRAFSQFRAVLANFPREQRRWRQFRMMYLTTGLREKLRAREIELVLVSDESEQEPEPDY